VQLEHHLLLRLVCLCMCKCCMLMLVSTNVTCTDIRVQSHGHLLVCTPCCCCCCCSDHLNLMTANPLRGPNPPELGGPRFLDLSGQTQGRTGQHSTAELGHRVS
jgi:hypothetical protein